MEGSGEGRAMLDIEDEILRMAGGVKPDHTKLSVSEVGVFPLDFLETLLVYVLCDTIIYYSFLQVQAVLPYGTLATTFLCEKII